MGDAVKSAPALPCGNTEPQGSTKSLARTASARASSVAVSQACSAMSTSGGSDGANSPIAPRSKRNPGKPWSRATRLVSSTRSGRASTWAWVISAAMPRGLEKLGSRKRSGNPCPSPCPGPARASPLGSQQRRVVRPNARASLRKRWICRSLGAIPLHFTARHWRLPTPATKPAFFQVNCRMLSRSCSDAGTMENVGRLALSLPRPVESH